MGEYGVFGGAVKGFDPQVLFEPTEEEFHLPTASIQIGHSNSRNREVVGQKDKAPGRFRVDKLDKAQFVRIIPMRVEVAEHDGLVATQSSVAIRRMGVEPSIPGIALALVIKKAVCVVMS